MDILIRIIAFQKKELGDHQVGHMVVNGLPQKDDPVFQQAGIDIKGPFAPVILFDYDGY
jgi:hypothetical protein